MSASEILSRHGWARDAATGVWRSGDAGTIDYSDGDAGEAAVLEALGRARDLSSGSDELRAMIVDWPTEYHLSPERANLLRPLPFRKGDLVLELGAGCGALTRFVAEAGAEVVAVEGSPRRAQAAARRCADLPNVAVACADLSRFAVAKRFDWVLMIGVLEYARVYGTGEDPVRAYLEQARRLASRDGCLVLAIENQLGLKYLAGCSEDHIGAPYVGIEDRYPARGPVTFGREALRSELASAGWTAARFLYPFPDYKLPLDIVHESALDVGAFELADLVSRGATRDYSGHRPRAFSERLAWQPVATNALCGALANSFLVLASATARLPRRFDPGVDALAWSFSANRRRAHCVATRFIRDSERIRVEKRDLHDRAISGSRSETCFTRALLADDYVPGRLLSTSIVRALARGEPDDFVDRLLLIWLDALLARTLGRDKGPLQLPEDFVDAIPANAVIDERGKLRFFDLEWRAARSVPLAWVVLRGVLGLVLSVEYAGAWAGRTPRALAASLLAARRIALTDDDVEEAARLDEALLREARFGTGDGAFPLTAERLNMPVEDRFASLSSAVALARARAALGDAATAEAMRAGAELALLRNMLDSERAAHAENIAKLRAASAALHESAGELAAFRERHHEAAAAMGREIATLRGLLSDEQRMNAANIAKLVAADALAHLKDQELGRQASEHAAAASRLREDVEALRRMLAEEQQLHATNIAKLVEADARAHHLSIAVARLGDERLRMESEHGAATARLEEDRQALSRALARERAAHEEAKRATAVLAARDRHTTHALGEAAAVIERQAAEMTALRDDASTWSARAGRRLAGVRVRLFPAESRRGRWMRLAGRFADCAASEGFGVASRKAWARVARRWGYAAPVPSAPQVPPLGAPAFPPELARWIELCEPVPGDLERQRAEQRAFALRPLISVVLPVYKVPDAVLRQTLQALLEQTYDHWEACIAFADTDNEAHWRLLEDYAARDSRFRLLRLEENLGISANSNAALRMAVGEFVALLDHDDTLSPSALHAVVEAMQGNANVDFFYTDKDSIDAEGRTRMNALFKPEWSPEMMHSVNYLTHLNVMRRSVVEDVGGWRSETDGAQDWDLFFRVLERTGAILRVPGMHYHWRILPTSTSAGLQAKPYAANAQLRCQQDRLQRLGLNADAQAHDECGFRIAWRLPAEALADVVVMARGHCPVRPCLDTLRFADLRHVGRVRVIMPPGAPESEAVARDFRDVWGDRVLFSAASDDAMPQALHTALRACERETCIVLDGRARLIAPDTPTELAGWMHGHPQVAWVAGIALAMDESVYEAGRVLGPGRSAPLFRGVPLRSWGWFGGALWYRNVSAASPYAFAARCGDLNAHPPGAGESIEAWWTRLCAGLRRDGRRGLVDPHARIFFDQDPEPNPPPFDSAFAADPYFHPFFCDVSPLRLLP